MRSPAAVGVAKNLGTMVRNEEGSGQRDAARTAMVG
jgi:hypothetical protein